MKPLYALLLFSLLLQSGGQSIAIPIQNPSFEQVTAPFPGWYKPECGTGGWSGDGAFIVPGWRWGASTGVFQPNNPNPCGVAVPVPDGTTVAYAGYGGSFSQDLGVKASDLQSLSRDGIYDVQFSAADYFGPYPAAYEVSLSLGTLQPDGSHTNVQELCSKDGWATQNWTVDTMICFSPGYLVFDKIFVNGNAIVADPNAHLFVTFTGYGWTLLVDKVSANFSPG